ncbi:MAG: diguanylate cyclase [Myxococcales bacterium]|nr:diguanylate cyclase [Myxococcales bacterium]
MTANSEQRVLVIDDSQDIHNLVEVRLRADGITVLHALESTNGLSILRTERVDLVLLDLDLETDNGIDVCRQILSDDEIAMVPIIFLTGTVDIATKVKAFEAGAVDYVTKPFDAVELRARVRAALRTKRYHDLLASRARVDGLTGLGNRSYFDEQLERQLESDRRSGVTTSLIMLDIDHFKSVNDTFGHPFGDMVLQRVADAARAVVRPRDIPCRYGGEEICIVLPETTLDAAEKVAERIRESIQAIALIQHGKPVVVTASLGIAEADSASMPHGVHLLAEADAALYRAKESGRNRVCR